MILLPSPYFLKNVLGCEIQTIGSYSYHNQAILPVSPKYSVVLCPSATLMPIAQEIEIDQFFFIVR